MLSSFGILSITASECTKLVGVGTDGASANIAAGGLNHLGPIIELLRNAFCLN